MTCLPLSTSDIDKESPIGQIMLSEDIPFEEAFWRWVDSLDIKMAVINGYAYGYEETPRSQKGGTFKRLYLSDEQRTVKLNAIWRIGKTTRPNTAKLVSTEEYRKASARMSLCNLKGCFDRYNCAWYDIGEEADGPWNEIPSDWNVGDEKCESFLLKNV
jgi:hypothetical protein